LRFIGDIHGNWELYQDLIRECPESVQVGDFGIGFPREDPWHLQETRDAMKFGSHRYIRGNHDNPKACKTDEYWIPDGLRESGIMYVGGAYSIDRNLRTEGFDFWSDEELSYNELARIIATYEEYKPNVMVTHDLPDAVARALISWYTDPTCESRTRLAFNSMFEIHKPKLWISGHWHTSQRANILGTDFIILNIGETFDIDLEKI